MVDEIKGLSHMSLFAYKSKRDSERYPLFKRILSITLLISIVMSIFLLSACRNNEQVIDGPLVYTSFYPVYDLTKSVAEGTDVHIDILMPAEQDPHMWEPTPRDLQKLAIADMLIVNGANMEERWLAGIRESLPNLKIVDLSEDVDLITYKGQASLGEFQYMVKLDLEGNRVYPIEFGHTHEEFMRIAFIKAEGQEKKEDMIAHAKSVMLDQGETVEQYSLIEVENEKVYKMKMGHTSGMMYYQVPESGSYYLISDRLSEALLSYRLLEEEGGEDLPVEVILAGSTSSLDKTTYDPHSWMSTINAKIYLNAINQSLAASYPHYSKNFNRNKVRMVNELALLEHEFKDKFAAKENKVFVVTHYAYAYLARDFGLDQYPLQGLTSMGSISLHTLRRAIAFCRENHVSKIFYEAKGNSRDAYTIAWEIGGDADTLNSMEFVSKSAEIRYIDIMRDNLERLEQSMR
jgi:zinc transport system substrate-binding protein